jgi:hypothetical protein
MLHMLTRALRLASSIRSIPSQHTSAYVSIRQHTSAYVSSMLHMLTHALRLQVSILHTGMIQLTYADVCCILHTGMIQLTYADVC